MHVVPHNLRPCTFAQYMAGMHGAEASKIPPYCSNRPSPNLCKCWLLTFAGKLDFGRVGATSATEWPMLWFTEVATKPWMLSASCPLRTIAIHKICPLSFIFLFMTVDGLRL